MRGLIEKIFVHPTSNIWLQLFRYGFVGGVAFVADYGSLYILTEWVGLYYLLSAAIAFLLGLTVNYLISISWVFNKNRHSSVAMELLIFTLIGVVGLLLNEGIMYVATDCLSLHYMFSKLASTVMVFFWNFFARKFILFRQSV